MREQQLDDVMTGLRIEVAGGLVGKDNDRLVGERARDRDALLLSAGQLRRIVMAAILEADFDQQIACAGRRVAPAGDFHRHQNVLERRQRRDEMKGLKDEPDLRAAQPRQFVFAETSDVGPVDQNRSASTGRRARRSGPSSVDLPLPDGPTIASRCPEGTVRSRG